MSVEENDLRKDLEAAFEQHAEEANKEAGGSPEDASQSVRDTKATEGQASEPTTTDSGTGEQKSERADGRDGLGRFKTAGEAKPEGAPKTDPQAQPEGAPNQAAPEQIAAPAGWKPAAREHWAKLPRPVQEEVTRREKEAALTVRQSSQARQLAKDFQNTVNPFMPMIQAQGSNPIQAVRNLMTTAAGLTVGTQIQKAQILREIIQNYGVDVATLDQVLAGQPLQPQQGYQQQNQLAPPPWANPIFQFMNTVQQQRAAREQQTMTDAEAETEAFAAKNEFFEDVREEMADLMEMSARRGVVLSLQDAYNKAVSLNPDINSVVQQRNAARKAGQQQNTIQRNRNAASSISGGPKGGPAGNGGGGDDSRRSAISEAWDAQMGR